jgi:hypothetical protein
MTITNYQKLAIKDLAKKTICDGHLYISGKESRRFYVLQPGMIIDEDFIKKHAVLNTTFDFLPVVKPQNREGFHSLFKELKYSQFEIDQRNKCLEVLRFFHETYSEENHFLDFALAAFEEFNLIPLEDLKRMHSIDINLFRKSLYSAAFSVVVAMANDFYHYMLLRDLFNLTLSLDMGLCDSHYSYFVAKGCNQENRLPGSGLKWMRDEKASELEIKVYLGHPQKSYEFIKSKSALAYPELAEIALYQHELASGEGFPRGIKKGLISSWEAVVVLASSLVDIEESFAFETKALSYLTSFSNEKLSLLPIGKSYSKLCGVLGFLESEEETGT